MISAYVHQWNDGIHVLCVFQHTLSDKCYVQLVSTIVGGFHEGEYLEGEEEASYRFTDLASGTYAVLVYGLEREEMFCSLPHDPNYITVISLSNSQQLTPVTSFPTNTHDNEQSRHNLYT